MPTRSIDPRERELIRRLVDLGVGSAVSTLREALRIGYSCEAVAGILDFYERETLTDDAGALVRPYYVGQLVTRLRDEYATEARPDCGKWGGRTAEWSALKLRLNPVKPAGPRVPDLSLTRRAGVIESLTRDQVLAILDELIDRGGDMAERAGKCGAWMVTGWPEGANRLVPPENVTRFLMQVDVERILG